MKLNYFLILISIFTSISIASIGQNDGEALFKATCTACHSIGKGKLIGPDLQGISEKRDQEWLISFIRSSRSLINEGDSLANALFEEYNKIPMPDNDFSDNEIMAILDYISKESSLAVNAASSDKKSEESTTWVHSRDNSVQGSMLFSGTKVLANKGGACISCHSIKNYLFLGGGKLSLDLTKSYEKLGSEGLKAIIINPPFPAMREAFSDKKVEEEEALQIIDFLYFVNENSAPNDSQKGIEGLTFLLFGLVVAGFVLIYIFLLWRMGSLHKNEI